MVTKRQRKSELDGKDAVARARGGPSRGTKKSGSLVDLSEVHFDPTAEELTRTWSSFASHICCLNPYPNGITFSTHGADQVIEETDEGTKVRAKYFPSQFHLRLKETRDYLLPDGRFFLFKEHFAESLERRLQQLKERGILERTVFYFGTTTDPFAAFHKRFDVTMTCLHLLERYRPALVVVQTRSPMVLSALPMLKVFDGRALAAISIESHLESSIAQYTPGQPRIADRLIAADGLRKQGIAVQLLASPILPYGDVYRNAWDFAEVLDTHSDYIGFGCLACGGPNDEPKLRELPLAKRLVAAREVRMLRPYAFRNLYYAANVICPEKLLVPLTKAKVASQMDLFAA